MTQRRKNKYDQFHFYLVGVGIALIILLTIYVLTGRIVQNSGMVFLRDFLLIIVLYTPTWILGNWSIKKMNKLHFLRTSFLLRFARGIGMALVLSALTLLLLYAIRTLVFGNYRNIFTLLEFSKIFPINFVVIQLLEYFNFFISEREEIIRREKMEKEQYRLKNEMLKEQMNPHFLFNSLNVLSSLIYLDQDRANKYTKELSKLYRYILNSGQNNLVPIHNELKFLKSYFYILELRFGNSIIMNIHNADKARGNIVPLTLQLLVENAQKHNAFSRENPLSIDVIIGEDTIQVVNSLNLKTSVESGKVGLRYIRTLYNDLGYPIDINTTKGSYTVKIPLILTP